MPIRQLYTRDKNVTDINNFTFRYIDGVFSLIYSKFGAYVARIYPIELEIKDTTDTVKSASYLAVHVEIDNEARVG